MLAIKETGLGGDTWRRVQAGFGTLQPACEAATERRPGPRHRERDLTGHGHRVRLVAPRQFQPFPRWQRNDAADAAAILQAPLLPRPSGLGLQPVSFSAQGSSLLWRSGVAKFRSKLSAARCLASPLPLAPNQSRPMAWIRDAPVSRAISRIGSFCHKCIRLMMLKSPLWITPSPPPLAASGKGSHGSSLG